MAVRSIVETVRETLRAEMRRDPSIILMGEDVGVMGGVFLATEGLLKEFGPERVMDTPLSESAIVGVAIGASLNGLHPVAEIQFADFIWGAMEQLVSEAAKMRWRSLGGWACPLVLRVPYGGGIRGGPYHSQSIEAVFGHIPGLKVVAPATPYDVKGLLRASLQSPDPVLFLEHKKTYRLIKGEVPDEDYTVPIGKAEVKRQGRHLSVISYGLMLHLCLQAAQELEQEGIEAEVVDVRSIRPLDTETILASVRKTSKALVVHEDTKFLGFGAEVSALIMEEAFDHLDAPVLRVAAPEVAAFGISPVLEDFSLPSVEKITQALRHLAAY